MSIHWTDAHSPPFFILVHNSELGTATNKIYSELGTAKGVPYKQNIL